MKKVSRLDLEFFFRLASLYDALRCSVVEPVSINESSVAGSRGVYFDNALDDHERNRLAAIMKERTVIAQGDLIEHDDFHFQFIKLFYDVDESLNSHSRDRTADAVTNLCQLFRDYTDFVSLHHEKLGRDSFLNYPYSLYESANLFGAGDIVLRFNSGKTRGGALFYTGKIEELVTDFQIQSVKLPPRVQIANRVDSGEGFTDGSLRAGYEINRGLLLKVGFKFPEID